MIHQNVPSDMVDNCIRTAQDLELMPLLGNDLYKYINDNLFTLSGQHKELMDNYIKDVLLYATMADLVLLGTYQMYTKGITKKRDEFSDSVDFMDVEKIADRYRYSLDNYKLRLVNFLKSSGLVSSGNGADYSCSVYLKNDSGCGC
jgi:hypothetical protein